MLEVIGEDPNRDEVIVVAGLGRSAQWFQNLPGGGATEVAIGRKRFEPSYRELDPPEAAAVLANYERRNRYLAPLIRRMLSWLVGWRYDGTPAKRLQLANELPMVAFRPAHGTADTPGFGALR